MNCTKTKFADEASEEFYISKLKRTSVRDRVPLRAYLCQYCCCWHLTSKVDTHQPIKVLEIEKENDRLKLEIDTMNKKMARMRVELAQLRDIIINRNKTIKLLTKK